MSDTRIVSKNTLVNQNAIQYIRAQTLTLTIVESRPNTKMYVFANDVNVTHRCNLVGSVMGTTITTDIMGQAVIEYNIASGTLNTGNVSITIADTDVLSNLATTGSVFGSATAIFKSTGVLKVFQETQTTIKKVTRTVNVKQDPLAQSFFTYGVKGGMFLTSIDIYFQTKDTSIPVRCEIRPMVNGYPAPLEANHLNMVSILAPTSITTSTNSSIATKFTFNPPIYLDEDTDYCFVLRSNSNNYNVFTSRMGERSIEDNVKIYDNPYIGSLFKSENNITWTAEQFEDIKFKINKAVFDTNATSVARFAAEVPGLGAFGEQFTTVSGSNIITYRHNQEHGLEVGSKFKITTRTDTLYGAATFNGIPYTQFNATHNITQIVDRNTLKFQVASSATSSGIISTTKIVNYVSVLNEGINYLPSPTDTITFTNGGGGTGAAGTLNVISGNIKSINITNSGTGYTSAPIVSVTSATGTLAELVASVTPVFTVYVNKPMLGFIPKVNIFNVASSKTVNTIDTTIGNYDGGLLSTYSLGKSLNFVDQSPVFAINQNSVIASTYNETASMSGNKSTKLAIELKSDNPNVSPIIDTNDQQFIQAYSNKINNQTGETITSTSSSGTVDTITRTNNGLLYTVTPIVTISAPDISTGTQAIATATLTGASISAITVTIHGSGYTSVPTVNIERGFGDTTGTGGAGRAVLTTFNTELLPSGGLAKSRYITKKTTLQIVSTGVRLFSVLSSLQGSSVDWYIRTSLTASSIDHSTQNWRRLSCDTIRNKSSYNGEMFEYLFYLNDIAAFDNYDLKAVFTTDNPINAPIINSYRLIVVV